MSFFDEVDEPQQPSRSEPRRPRATRTPGGRGSGRPPGNNQQSVQTRRLILVVVVVVVVILMAVLIHGCQASATRNSLRTYNSNVSSLINASDSNGKLMFNELGSGAGASTLSTELAKREAAALTNLNTAQGLGAPSQMNDAQQYLVLVMTQRYDGMRRIAENIQAALNSSTSKDGVYEIAFGNSVLYSSDVIYKGYVATAIAKALNAGGITVCPPGAGSCGADSTTINGGQIVPNLGWLEQSLIAIRIGADAPSSEVNQKHSTGVTGHILNSVSVGGTTLDTGATNTVKANPAPSFVLNVSNGGDYTEYDVDVKVSIKGLKDSGKSVIRTSKPGQTYTPTVTLPTAPPSGTYTVVVTVVPVPSEKNTADNTLTYQVNFN